MVNRYFSPAFLSAALILFSSNCVQAADKPDSLFKRQAYISPSVQYIIADSSRNSDDGIGGALALGFNFNRHLSVEAEGNFNQNSMDIKTGGTFDQVGANVNGLLRFPVGNTFEPYLIAGVGALTTDTPATKSTNTSLLAGLGTFIGASDSVLLRLDARYRLDTDDQSIPNADPFEDFVISAGVVFPFGAKMSEFRDDDHDSVRNEKDLCPNTPAGTEVDATGCTLDSDGDGVNNDTDRCPGTPANTIVDINGCELDGDNDQVVDRLDRCPNTPPNTDVDAEGCAFDSDRDGVANSQDRCPNTPAGVQVDQNGCALDDDQDGVANAADACPNTAMGAQVDTRGCELDSDEDGIVNHLDKCPNTPRGVKVDERGCEIKGPIRLQGLRFKFNSVELANPEDNKSLQEALAILKRYNNTKVLIVGHTDSIGSAAYNLALSLKRANAIRDYLVEHGINPANLRTAGKGEAEPIADNHFEKGRAQNRRVELHILE